MITTTDHLDARANASEKVNVIVRNETGTTPCTDEVAPHVVLQDRMSTPDTLILLPIRPLVLLLNTHNLLMAGVTLLPSQLTHMEVIMDRPRMRIHPHHSTHLITHKATRHLEQVLTIKGSLLTTVLRHIKHRDIHQYQGTHLLHHIHHNHHILLYHHTHSNIDPAHHHLHQGVNLLLPLLVLRRPKLQGPDPEEVTLRIFPGHLDPAQEVVR